MTKTYMVTSSWQMIPDASNVASLNDDTIPLQNPQAVTLIQTLMAPPTEPQVSGLVIQTSVWIPRSIHWFFSLSKLNALFT